MDSKNSSFMFFFIFHRLLYIEGFFIRKYSSLQFVVCMHELKTSSFNLGDENNRNIVFYSSLLGESFVCFNK